MKFAYLLIGILLGYVLTPTFQMYEVTELVWVHADPTRQEMMDSVVCYMEARQIE